jgi:DNA-binding NarL/FixJ family response regulator
LEECKRLNVTAREREILELVSEGHTNAYIAAKLGLSELTVKTHLHNIYTKTGLCSRTALVVRFLREGAAA